MRILVALDGSPSSLDARDLVASVPWKDVETIHLLTAYEAPIDWSGAPGSTMAWVGDVEDALRDAADETLRRLAEPLAERGWPVERSVRRGRPATTVIEAAREMRADLVVVGSRGRGQLQSMLLGSVSAEVLDDAPCSVLVSRSGRVTRAMLTTDGSATARTVPDAVAGWGLLGGVPVESISVAPPAERVFELLAGLYTFGSYREPEDHETAVRRHREFADEGVRRLADHGIAATPVVATGDAAREIVAAAERSGADLVITGSRGLSGLERVVLGSVARNVAMHASCSVLVVRDPVVASRSSAAAAGAGIGEGER